MLFSSVCIDGFRTVVLLITKFVSIRKKFTICKEKQNDENDMQQCWTMFVHKWTICGFCVSWFFLVLVMNYFILVIVYSSKFIPIKFPKQLNIWLQVHSKCVTTRILTNHRVSNVDRLSTLLWWCIFLPEQMSSCSLIQ